MKRIQSGLVVLLLAASFVWATAPPSPACSVRMPPSLDEVIETGTAFEHAVTGVFEIEHIAYAPNFGIRTARSVSVVTRYWGETPPNLGRVSHGEFWLGGGSSCGNGNRDLGVVSYSWTDGTEENRGQFSGISTDRESARSRLSVQQEAALTAVFGPPVELGPSAVTRTVAWAQIWWLPTLLGLAVGAVILFPLRRHALLHAATARVRFQWHPLAVAVVVAAAIPLLNRLHEDFELDITPAWAVLLVGAIAAATALSPPIAGLGVGAVWLVLTNRLIGEFGELPFRGLSYSGLRLTDGLLLTLLGLGLLAAARRHWSGLMGLATLMTGSAAFASSLWPLSGHISWLLIIPTTLAATALTLWFGVWVIGINLRGASTEPLDSQRPAVPTQRA